MDFVWKLYGVTVALVGVATLNLALPPPLGYISMRKTPSVADIVAFECIFQGKFQSVFANHDSWFSCLESHSSPRNINFRKRNLTQVAMEDLFLFIQILPQRSWKPLCMLVCIDMIHHICKRHYGSLRERGLFLKNVFQGCCPQQTAAKQFPDFWFRLYFFRLAAIRDKLVNDSYITQQWLTPRALAD